MKIIKKTLISLFLFLIVFLSMHFLNFGNSYQNKNTIIKKEVKYKVYFYGAVENNGPFFVEPFTQLSNLLNLSKIKYESDLSKIDLNEKILSNKTFYIPYVKNAKFQKNLNYINSIEELLILKINKKSADTIWNKIKIKKVKEWKEIESLNGIGPSIITKLKQNFTLDI